MHVFHLHLDAEKVSETDLSYIVGDVFIVHQVRTRDVGRSWFDRDVRLAISLAPAHLILGQYTYHHATFERWVDTTGILPFAGTRFTHSPS